MIPPDKIESETINFTNNAGVIASPINDAVDISDTDDKNSAKPNETSVTINLNMCFF